MIAISKEFFISKPFFRSMAIMGSLGILSACSNVDDRAAENGCPRLAYEIEVLFLGAGQMRQAEKRIAKSVEKYGFNREPHARSAAGGKSGKAALINADRNTRASN